MKGLTPSLRVGRLARKELREILRDRRTIITLVFMPVLLYPILSIAFNQYFMTNVVRTQRQRVGVGSAREKQIVEQLLQVGGKPAIEFEVVESPDIERDLRNLDLEYGVRTPKAHVQAARGDDAPIDLQLIIIQNTPASQETTSTLVERLQAGKNRVTRQSLPYKLGFATQLEADWFQRVIRHAPKNDSSVQLVYALFESQNLDEDLRQKNIDLGVRILNAGHLQPGADVATVEFELAVAQYGLHSNEAAKLVAARITDANLSLFQRMLEARGMPRRPLPATSVIKEVKTESKSSLLASLIPLVLVLMTITGAVYPSIDLTAGERERGTLEILMAAPVPRVGLLLAKYIAVLTVTVLTGLVNLTSMTITIWVSGLGRVLFGETGLSLATVVGVLGLLLLMAMFFSAVLLAVTSFARSFKEAQAYLIPIMLAALTPGMIALLPGMKLGGFVTVTPLLNVVLLAKELFEGEPPLADAVIVVVSTLLYACGAIAMAARVFGAEAVLYSEQGQIGDLFRRPRQPRLAVTLTSALFCLALVFAIQFVIGGASARLRADLAIEWRLLMSIVVSIVLFAGFPFVWSWFGRVRLLDGWQLRRAPLLAFPAALLLGLSLWPCAAEAELLIRKAGVTSLPANFDELIRPLMERWRSTSPVLVLLAVAVTPAVVEEIFFRGFLFNAFPYREHPWRTIFGTALLFGAFHILMMNVLIVERLVPATLLGVALGWLRWKTGSVFPGMLLHVTNNALLVLMGLYPHWFGSLAAATEGSAHMPIIWLAAAAPVALAGIALAWVAGRKRLAV